MTRTDICDRCLKDVGTYNTGSLNRRRPAKARYCLHDSEPGQRCMGSYQAVVKVITTPAKEPA